MKHKKWLFPILSAAVASVAVVAVWINVESKEQGGQKVIKGPQNHLRRFQRPRSRVARRS